MNDNETRNDAAAALHASDEARSSDELGPFAETAAALGLAVTPVTPPDALRARLMAQIALTPQLAPLDEAEAAAPAASTQPAAPTPAAVPTPEAAPAPAPGPAERRAARRWSPLLVGTVAAAAAVALFFGGVAIGQLGTAGQTPETPLAGQTEELANLAAAPDAQRAAVELDNGGSATLMWSGELAQSALFVDGLPKLDAAESYQLWYIGADGAVSAGLLEAGSAGPSWRVLDGQMSAGDVVGVTVEPAGGSTQPTSDPVIKIQS